MLVFGGCDQIRGSGPLRGQVTSVATVDSTETHYKITFEDGSSEVMKESEVLTILEPSLSASSAAMAASSVDRRHITLVGLPVQRRDPPQIVSAGIANDLRLAQNDGC